MVGAVLSVNPHALEEAARSDVVRTQEGGHLDALVALTNTPGWVTKYFNRDGAADDLR